MTKSLDGTNSIITFEDTLAFVATGNANARVYLSFEDFNAANKLTVLEYNCAVWSYLGSSAGNSKALEWDRALWTSVGTLSEGSYPQLAFDGLGNLFSAGSSVFGFSGRQYSP